MGYLYREDNLRFIVDFDDIICEELDSTKNNGFMTYDGRFCRHHGQAMPITCRYESPGEKVAWEC